MIDTLVALEERFRAAGTAARLGVEPGGYAARHPAPPGAGRRAAAARRRCAQLAALAARDAGRLPGPPAHPQDDGGVDADAPGPAADRAARLPRLPLADGRRRRRPHRLRRIQEETTYLGVPCFTLRDNTERPVTIRAGTNTLLGLDPAAIADIPAALAERPATRPAAAAALGRPRRGADRRRHRWLGLAPAGRDVCALCRRPRRLRSDVGRRLGRPAASAPRRVGLGSASSPRLALRRPLCSGASSMLMLRPSCSGC